MQCLQQCLELSAGLSCDESEWATGTVIQGQVLIQVRSWKEGRRWNKENLMRTVSTRFDR